MPGIIESYYPLDFRKEDAISLGEHLRHRHSVILIGMKRVGISNFLRFFINHKDIVFRYIADNNKHLFISVDLNDLVEREIIPFWILTLKRLLDGAKSSDISPKIKREIESLFLNSIQTQNLFFTIDSIRKAVALLIEHGILPTLFFIRFDRMKDVATPEFFANLQGLKDTAGQKLAYVFTSYRSLNDLSPQVFAKASLSVFVQNIYFKPAKKQDARVIYHTYRHRYKLVLSKEIEDALFEIVDGYVQYLQLALIALHQTKEKIETKTDLLQFLLKDERIYLQSEELWESLSRNEQDVLLRIKEGHVVVKEAENRGRYLWDTGILIKGKKIELFSPLFEDYLDYQTAAEKEDKISIEFTKKEYALISFFQKKVEQICEREEIIEAVWPEVEELGVSDWAIDRLIARLRAKLKAQKSQFEIQTIKTRGYKLVEIVSGINR